MCGIIGISNRRNVAYYLVEGLYQLQHRGEDSAGIAGAGSDRFDPISLYKGVGHVGKVFEEVPKVTGHYGIGQVRYPTYGETKSKADIFRNAQPLYVDYPYPMAMAHNGNVTNGREMRQRFDTLGANMATDVDLEYLLKEFAYQLESKSGTLGDKEIFKAIGRTMDIVEGAYSVVGILNNNGKEKLFSFTDERRIRPLVHGIAETKDGLSYAVASESVAFDHLGFDLQGDLGPGEALVASDDGMVREILKVGQPAYCQFEFRYFSRPSSISNGLEIEKVRRRHGRAMGQRDRAAGLEIDVIIPSEDSGVAYAYGYAEGYGKSAVLCDKGQDKNKYVGRYFINLPEMRDIILRRKFNAIGSRIRDKRFVWIDDSFIRGNTAKITIEKFFGAGAKEVHFRPSIKVTSPCPYGVDMTTNVEFFGRGKTDQEIERELGLEGRGSYRSPELDDLTKATNMPINNFCVGCLTGEYPTEVSHILKHADDPSKRSYEHFE